MSDMIDRVAFHLAAAGGADNPEDARRLARVAIEAMREPTAAMVDSGAHAACVRYKPDYQRDNWPETGLYPDADTLRECADACWGAIIDEALK